MVSLRSRQTAHLSDYNSAACHTAAPEAWYLATAANSSSALVFPLGIAYNRSMGSHGITYFFLTLSNVTWKWLAIISENKRRQILTVYVCVDPSGLTGYTNTQDDDHTRSTMAAAVETQIGIHRTSQNKRRIKSGNESCHRAHRPWNRTYGF